MLISFDYLFKKYSIKPEGILHLGANRGQEADAYARLGVNQVIWVEALPGVHKELCERLLRFPGNLALCACLGEENGKEVVFHVANNEAQSSSYLELGTHAERHPDTKYIQDIPMKTVRVDTLLSEEGMEIGPHWFLNVDLQGADLLALRGMGRLLNQFDWAYVEVNKDHLYKGCALVGEVDAYLVDFGLVPKETKWMKQGWGDRFYGRL